MPCQKSAVVGIKPTPGLVSREGMFVVNEYQDTAEPIARTVRDAARLLQVMAGLFTLRVFYSTMVL
jgi:amidase